MIRIWRNWSMPAKMKINAVDGIDDTNGPLHDLVASDAFESLKPAIMLVNQDLQDRFGEGSIPVETPVEPAGMPKPPTPPADMTPPPPTPPAAVKPTTAPSADDKFNARREEVDG